MEKHAGAWLKAIPTEPKLSIPSDKMVIALRLFLGIPLQKDVECPIHRKVKKVDDINVHMLICSTNIYWLWGVPVYIPYTSRIHPAKPR